MFPLSLVTIIFSNAIAAATLGANKYILKRARLCPSDNYTGLLDALCCLSPKHTILTLISTFYNEFVYCNYFSILVRFFNGWKYAFLC